MAGKKEQKVPSFLLKFPTNFAVYVISSKAVSELLLPILCNFQQLYLMLYSNYGVLSQ